MIEILNICLHQNSIFIKFLKILKIHEIFCENPGIIFVLFYDVQKENMFTINLEDGREAPSKASTINIVPKHVLRAGSSHVSTNAEYSHTFIIKNITKH